jgi:hypothetical protein
MFVGFVEKSQLLTGEKISAAEIKQRPTNSLYDLITNMQTIRRIYRTRSHISRMLCSFAILEST